ncbi:MAG: aldo/keto reductase [Acidobacteria bacterium]|nr:MAG: aldo/keto reductase [Acidobacteriota bacterium]
MRYVTLGRSGLKVSEICLGTMTFGNKQWNEWVLSEEESRPLIRRALELGINFFDTADVYSRGGSEQILGKALRDFAPRDQVVIATKVNGPMGAGPNDRGLSRKHVLDAVNASLRRLETDYIDLYQIHRWDYETAIEETLDVLHDLVKSGKVRYVGASSMFAWQFAKSLYLADQHGWTRFVAMQNHYNLVYREEEREMIPLCLAEGIGILPWSPMARGFLAGNRSRQGWGQTLRAKTDDYAHRLYYADSDFQVAERVMEIARERSLAPTQIALAWLLAHPGVTAPVIGVTRMEHLEQGVAAVGIRLDEAECRRLEEPYRPHPVLGHP